MHGLLPRRIAAYVLDSLILFVVLAPLGQGLQRWFGLAPPRSGPALARMIAWNFSLPTWLYLLLSDRSRHGMTLSKRLMRIQVRGRQGGRLTTSRALLRTAIKLLPWELVHWFAFARSTDLTQFRPDQALGVAVANTLALGYLGVTMTTKGRQSVHDVLVGTWVQLTEEARDDSP